ncbi:MAG: hypothetical protein ACRDQ2_16245 [Gaiellales bacterium]
MPAMLRARLALFAFLGVFLIPIAASSLRGLTHVLTCREESNTPFTLVIGKDRRPSVLTSTRLSRGEQEGLCGGLILDLRARGEGPGKVAMIVAIANRTPRLWRGSVALVLGRVSIPVEIGRIRAGARASETVVFTLTEGTHDLKGSLLIGP